MERSHFDTRWPVSVALVDPTKTYLDVCSATIDQCPFQGTGGSLFRSVRATRSDTTAVRLVNVKLGLDSEKKEAYQLPSKSEQRSYFRSTERTTFFSLHELCTQCFARFSVSPTFLRANF